MPNPARTTVSLRAGELARPARGEEKTGILRGVSKLLFQPTLAAETTGMGLNFARAICRRRQVRWVAGNHKGRAAGRREVNVRCLIRLRDQIRVVFVPQARFDFQVGSYLPGVLQIEMRPTRLSIFRALTYANLRLRWVAHQEIREGITAIGCRCRYRFRGRRLESGGLKPK